LLHGSQQLLAGRPNAEIFATLFKIFYFLPVCLDPFRRQEFQHIGHGIVFELDQDRNDFQIRSQFTLGRFWWQSDDLLFEDRDPIIKARILPLICHFRGFKPAYSWLLGQSSLLVACTCGVSFAFTLLLLHSIC
jgi:hypothetical protein